MKILFCRLVLLSVFVVLAACSKPRPPADVLFKAINTTLPAHLSAACKSFQYSPIKEVLGTTLPEGSYQVDVQTVVKAKEPLYILKSFSALQPHATVPEKLRAQIEELSELAEWSWKIDYSGSSDKPRPRLYGFLVEVTKTNEEKALWAKVIAEPRGAEWLVTVVEGEPQNAFPNAQPRAAFDSQVLIYGSDEQTRNIAEVKAAYTAATHRDATLKALLPAIFALEKSESELAERYDTEARDVLIKAIADSRNANIECGRRLDKIKSSTHDINDNYKTRDRLIKQEAERSSRESEILSARIKVLEHQRSLTKERAHAEIEAKIRELKQQHGLDI